MKPHRVFVQVTDRCDAGCAHCGFDCRPTGSGRVDPERVAAFLDDFADRFGPPTHLALTGGEPMQEPGLTCRLARLAAQRGIVVRLVTNAAWAESSQMAAKGIATLAASGVAGLWVSAGVFTDRAIGQAGTRNLMDAARSAHMPAFLNFTYFRPLAAGMRGKGRIEVDARIGADRETARIHAEWARRLPDGCHGWARIWDAGRARALIRGLGRGLASEVLNGIRRAEGEKDGLEDLMGFGCDGRILAGERALFR